MSGAASGLSAIAASLQSTSANMRLTLLFCCFLPHQARLRERRQSTKLLSQRVPEWGRRLSSFESFLLDAFASIRHTHMKTGYGYWETRNCLELLRVGGHLPDLQLAHESDEALLVHYAKSIDNSSSVMPSATIFDRGSCREALANSRTTSVRAADSSVECSSRFSCSTLHSTRIWF